ncbi:MAG: hypothetical protein R3A12_10620 [Ignavibacteria bacterium]
MDDVRLFNPYRLYGLVSMFNPETLRDITLITGGFPAKYGDGLSAVLDVTSIEGNKNRNLSSIINVSVKCKFNFKRKKSFQSSGSLACIKQANLL